MFSPFTDDVCAAFEAAYYREKPDEPDASAFRAAPQPRSVALTFANLGVCLRLALPEGETLDLTINPFLARAIAMGILQHGETAGWLDEDGNLRTSPTYRA